ncbi:hypothetical protein HF521_011139 [Silurus meridionalis]|uniref:Uncharacterized protein n=1 Tax=Silurus meridionalis TaxID=175797 RepID=A0A8T0AGZ5_SILME|nr:hypothetical protein HF521_011139 [Silurus meridionalis]
MAVCVFSFILIVLRVRVYAQYTNTESCVKPVFTPETLMVQFGDPAEVNCSIPNKPDGEFILGWESKSSRPSTNTETSVMWKVDKLVEWEEAGGVRCFFSGKDSQCDTNLNLTIYKEPDSVNLSSVSDVWVEGDQTELRCEVKNVGPGCNLSVRWSRADPKQNTFTQFNETFFPELKQQMKNVSRTAVLHVTPSREDDGVQYQCTAVLHLHQTLVFPSQAITISVHYEQLLHVYIWGLIGIAGVVAVVICCVMAELGPELFSEQELTCSICLDLFSEPVSTPCGHNFCQSCIGGYWASSSECTCPLCKRPFSGRPELSINRVFAHIAQKYKDMRYGGPPPIKPRQKIPAGVGSTAAGRGAGGELTLQNGTNAPDIPCDVCTGRKERAVSSCLTCIASYCETHVQPHRQTPFYASHRLLDPHEALRGRTCPEHGRLLEVFCRTDQRCICAICVLEEHRTHATVSVQTERAVKQRMLGKTELDIQTSIERRGLRITELKQRLQFLRNYAHAELSEVEQVLCDVTQSVERIRTELVGGIEDKRDSVIGQGERFVSELEVEVGKLQERRAQLEVQATSEDHISFLQSFEEVNAPYQDHMLNTDPDLELHFSLGEVKNALGEIRERLDDIHMGEVNYRQSVSSLPESESMMSVRSNKKKDFSLKDLRRFRSGSSIKKVRGYLEDVLLNPVTAYPFLILSDDRKQRKGLFDMSPSNGYYVLWWSTNHLRALTTPPLTKVKMNGRLRYLGVFLDCEDGHVTFYNAKTGAEIYSFITEGAFSEKMFPLFGTSDKEVPLMLPGGTTHMPE